MLCLTDMYCYVHEIELNLVGVQDDVGEMGINDTFPTQ